MDLDSPVDGIELPSLAARLSAHEEAAVGSRRTGEFGPQPVAIRT